MPIKVWKKGDKYCAKYGDSGKTYCRKSKSAAIALASKQAQAIHASGYKES